ncbi:MAG TPA: RNA polymerase sigma factor SigJ [Stackebrandtia sp.]|jgi:RNA polymerase sigma-70 factor (ECF subfamily)|uniref:RNA polymerase sigma factor SigJ n=1 Tax=Stackebrandtia sp. TaxID=2023065 RepID=UPI002D46DC6B|nr:RNA polymerase sigma factor SigJ [Stackebrandtia sp.]HZE39773.1 RNA polymerase sigma factor SigJ [Stackebrandtia sp.]
MSDDVFESHRRLLAAVAYRMLGSYSEAEDIVQDAWLRWNSALKRGTAIDNPRAYLIQVVSRLALDQLRSARNRHESYVGPWLPEPIATPPTTDDPAESAERADSASLGMLVMLESLSPAERVVYVLREAFGLPSAEVARILDKSDAAVRQLSKRAQDHVDERRSRFDADPTKRREATKRFLSAATSGDLAELLRLLDPDAKLVVDTDGRVRGPKRVIESADKIGRLFAAIVDEIPAGATVQFVDVNSEPAAVMYVDGEAITVFHLEVAGDRIVEIYWVANPGKLGRVAA